MTKEEIEKIFRDIADAMRDGFGMLLKEIKLLRDRMEAVEKKVGITKKETESNDLQITASPPKRGHEPGSESVNGAKEGKNDAQEPSSSKELSLVMAKEPEHWIAMWISIPKRHIVVWDSIVLHISREDLGVVMEPFVTMVPYLLVECAASDEQRVQHTLEPYTYERITVGVPQCRAGDCGVFTPKYIECHALGMSFPPEFCTKNANAIREKMALDIVKETLECHSKENEDNDENMETYDSQG
ncbi:hypothetical protein DY000_02031687 [Brassica cretica]|uniref:Ubiquitin-like protease family profile domain-containing protein n=1 Tax=Brassica cretica TaxID=69181 RepID=A0ABQ7DZ82_BRACR|nr:hypothetical protein DY000_02031687 [Brassica cretica]